MKTRSIKELLTILRDNEKLLRYSGLCWIIKQLMHREVISFKEYAKIDKYIKRECKKECEEYWYYKDQYEPFYFPLGEWAPRLEWLNRHIDKKSTKIR